jgi:hypothetical protein
MDEQKAKAQVALFLLARAMLNEEAVRCAAHLVRLLQLHGRTKDELEEARSIYLAIIQDHLCKCAEPTHCASKTCLCWMELVNRLSKENTEALATSASTLKRGTAGCEKPDQPWLC